MNFRISGSILAAPAMTLLAALTGCVIVDKTEDTDSDSGTASVSSTSGDSTSTPTTGSGTSGTGDETGLTGSATFTTEVPTSTDVSATGDSTTAGTTGGDTTGGGTTGGVDPGVQASCEAACAVFLECQPDSYPDLATCTQECIDGSTGGPMCDASATEFNNCIGGFTCDELSKALMGMDFGVCTDAFDAYIANCNP